LVATAVRAAALVSVRSLVAPVLPAKETTVDQAQAPQPQTLPLAAVAVPTQRAATAFLVALVAPVAQALRLQ
jgi:hypothetical protein